MIKYLLDKLFKVETWNICFSKTNIKKFIESKGSNLRSHAFIKNGFFSFFADPFIIYNNKNYAEILVEEYNFLKGGQISFLKINLKNRTFSKKIILRSKHFSYPFFIKTKKGINIFPEMSAENKNYYYFFNKLKITKKKIYFKKFNLIDPTFFKKKNLNFLFTSKQGNNENRKLLIFYSKKILEPWNKIKKIDFKRNIKNSRSAGKIFKFKNNYFRPSQDCSQGYGHQLNIRKILKLNKNEYNEKTLFKVNPKKVDTLCDGIHHIDFGNNLVFFDKKMYKYSIFKIIYKIIRFLN